MKSYKIIVFFIAIITLHSCGKDKVEPEEIIEPVLIFPELVTYEASDIKPISVKLGFSVTNQHNADIFEVGLIVGYEPGLTYDNNTSRILLPWDVSADYYMTLENLPEDNITIYVNSYAINPNGIGYGNEISFNNLGNKTHGAIELNNQEEVNAFGSEGYNTITGNLELSGNITDLSPLSDLYSVSGLNVTNTQLLNFEGLNKLERIRGDFNVSNNHLLNNFQGVNNLTEISSVFRIESNDNLTTLSGLDNLNAAGTIIIRQNPILNNLNGLESTTFVPYVGLYFNPLLSNVEAIKNLETLKGIIIEGNNSLTALPIFENIVDISTVDIGYNTSLNNLTAFQNVTNIALLELFQSNVTSLEGLNSLTYLGILKLNQNEYITSLNGLESLSTSNTIQINYNPNLADFCALNNLFTNGSIGTYGVEFNAINPTEEDIINGNCN
ncbi:hypothetical protein [Winogradskyella thalassocola]|uniref:Receptor L domain-containing protein n=1 Tax=Winogradskyella thalassocola TaxID=262004 RepID=A0A1G8H536_9FLAO|nr:hypothetical protein [Winogradskyella thalassocola]SDI01735.1 hypothetical protein SAMN04489796_106132 [Winogradskyella thalassocola]